MIIEHTRAEIQRLVAQGEYNVKSVTHWDVCNARKTGKKIIDISVEFDISERQVNNIISSKCPECKVK